MSLTTFHPAFDSGIPCLCYTRGLGWISFVGPVVIRLIHYMGMPHIKAPLSFSPNGRTIVVNDDTIAQSSFPLAMISLFAFCKRFPLLTVAYIIVLLGKSVIDTIIYTPAERTGTRGLVRSKPVQIILFLLHCQVVRGVRSCRL